MRDSSELQSGALPGELKRLDGDEMLVSRLCSVFTTLLLASKAEVEITNQQRCTE
jgi:hypothetical protein